MLNDTSSATTDLNTQNFNPNAIAESPALAMSSLYLSLSKSIAMSTENAVAAQQQAFKLQQIVTAKCVSELLNS